MALFEPIFDALNRAQIRYVVVGGFATVLHGHVELSRTVIRIAAIADLIRLKRRARRPQDLADIEALEIILRRKEGRGA